jgi:hypothetical protein
LQHLIEVRHSEIHRGQSVCKIAARDPCNSPLEHSILRFCGIDRLGASV